MKVKVFETEEPEKVIGEWLEKKKIKEIKHMTHTPLPAMRMNSFTHQPEPYVVHSVLMLYEDNLEAVLLDAMEDNKKDNKKNSKVVV